MGENPSAQTYSRGRACHTKSSARVRLVPCLRCRFASKSLISGCFGRLAPLVVIYGRPFVAQFNQAIFRISGLAPVCYSKVISAPIFCDLWGGLSVCLDHDKVAVSANRGRTNDDLFRVLPGIDREAVARPATCRAASDLR
jgi:hypothetical protein